MNRFSLSLTLSVLINVGMFSGISYGVFSHVRKQPAEELIEVTRVVVTKDKKIEPVKVKPRPPVPKKEVPREKPVEHKQEQPKLKTPEPQKQPEKQPEKPAPEPNKLLTTNNNDGPGKQDFNVNSGTGTKTGEVPPPKKEDAPPPKKEDPPKPPTDPPKKEDPPKPPADPPKKEDPPKEPEKPKGPTREAEPGHTVDPKIPDSVRSLEFKSFVRVRVIVESDGSFDVTLRTSSGNDEVDRAVLTALKKWSWKPALKDGEPVKSTKLFKFEFEIH